MNREKWILLFAGVGAMGTIVFIINTISSWSVPGEIIERGLTAILIAGNFLWMFLNFKRHALLDTEEKRIKYNEGLKSHVLNCIGDGYLYRGILLRPPGATISFLPFNIQPPALYCKKCKELLIPNTGGSGLLCPECETEIKGLKYTETAALGKQELQGAIYRWVQKYEPKEENAQKRGCRGN